MRKPDVVARWLMKSQLQGWGSLNKVVISLVTGARLVNLVVIAAQGIPYYGTPYYSYSPRVASTPSESAPGPAGGPLRINLQAA